MIDPHEIIALVQKETELLELNAKELSEIEDDIQDLDSDLKELEHQVTLKTTVNKEYADKAKITYSLFNEHKAGIDRLRDSYSLMENDKRQKTEKLDDSEAELEQLNEKWKQMLADAEEQTEDYTERNRKLSWVVKEEKLTEELQTYDADLQEKVATVQQKKESVAQIRLELAEDKQLPWVQFVVEFARLRLKIMQQETEKTEQEAVLQKLTEKKRRRKEAEMKEDHKYQLAVEYVYPAESETSSVNNSYPVQALQEQIYLRQRSPFSKEETGTRECLDSGRASTGDSDRASLGSSVPSFVSSYASESDSMKNFNQKSLTPKQLPLPTGSKEPHPKGKPPTPKDRSITPPSTPLVKKPILVPHSAPESILRHPQVNSATGVRLRSPPATQEQAAMMEVDTPTYGGQEELAGQHRSGEADSSTEANVSGGDLMEVPSPTEADGDGELLLPRRRSPVEMEQEGPPEEQRNGKESAAFDPTSIFGEQGQMEEQRSGKESSIFDPASIFGPNFDTESSHDTSGGLKSNFFGFGLDGGDERKSDSGDEATNGKADDFMAMFGLGGVASPGDNNGGARNFSLFGNSTLDDSTENATSKGFSFFGF